MNRRRGSGRGPKEGSSQQHTHSHLEAEADLFFARRVVSIEKFCFAPARFKLTVRELGEHLGQEEVKVAADPYLRAFPDQIPAA